MAITKVPRANDKGYAYRVRVTSYGEDGKRLQIGKTFDTQKEAEAHETKLKRFVETGSMLIPSQATVAEVVEEWLEIKSGEISTNSLVDYRSILEGHLLPALGYRKVQKLTTMMIQTQVRMWRADGVSDRRISDCVKRLRQVLEYAKDVDIVHENAAMRVRIPKATKDKKKASTNAWNASEAARFLAAAEAMPVMNRGGDTGRREPDWLWPLWPLLVLEGLRRGEALGLKWQWVNLEKGTITIVETVISDKENNGRPKFSTPKTESSGRTITLTSRSVEALKKHKAVQNQRRLASETYQRDLDLVIATRDGGPIAPANVQRSFERIVKQAGVKKIRVHDCRHTSATLLLQAGQPMKVVSERLGHTRVQITLDLYSHVLEGMDALAAAAMDAVLDASVLDPEEREAVEKIVAITG